MRALIAATFVALAAHGATSAVRNVTIVDPASGEARSRQTVVIRGDRIVASGPAASTRIPKAARILDGSRKYAIPGLWDMHVHLWDRENVLPEYVAYGVTGVRDMGSDFRRVSRWRAEIERGRAIGPRIVTCGPAVNGVPSNEPKLPIDVVSTPEQARREYDRLDEMHVDFVKVLSKLPREAYFALAERARHWGLPFAGHIPEEVTAEEAIDSRIASIEHWFNFPLKDEGRSRAALEKCAMFGTSVTPTLTLWRRMVQDGSTGADSLPLVDAAVRRAREAGVAILAGTDTGDPGTKPGLELHKELELLVGAGLTPAQALRTATTEPARFLHREQARPADLVLLDANPLEDIRNTRKIAGVFVRGRYVPKARLATLARPPVRK